MAEVMNNKVNLIDMNFKQLSMADKRVAFTLMDAMLKKLHEKNMMVTDFSPNKICYQDGFYTFEDVEFITDYYANDRDVAIFSNILALCNLAFCSYLPDYQLNQGMLNFEVISNNFDNFVSYLPEEDRDYYRGVLVDSYKRGKIDGHTLYYSDHIIKLGQNHNGSNNNSLAYVKATEAGKAFANKENEAAFGHNLFFITVVLSLIIGMIGIILYFSNYIG